MADHSTISHTLAAVADPLADPPRPVDSHVDSHDDSSSAIRRRALLLLLLLTVPVAIVAVVMLGKGPDGQKGPNRSTASPFPAEPHVERAIADGVTHRVDVTPGRQVANIVIVDLRRGGRLTTYKALDRTDGLEEVRAIYLRAGRTLLDDSILAAVNASFFRAEGSTAIGATVSRGEVIDMPSFRSWSSLILYDDGRAAIERIDLRGKLLWRRRPASIDNVNRRGTSDGVVIYNRYYGERVPRHLPLGDRQILAQAAANRSADGTEVDLDTAGILFEHREAVRRESDERKRLKIACAPVRSRPGAPLSHRFGDTMRYVVTAIDTGVISLPLDGFVISPGGSADWLKAVRVKDTMSLFWKLDGARTAGVRDIVSATPRLVRDGIAKPEQEIEGSKATRFVDEQLARTAVGISRGGDSLFVVTIDAPRVDGTVGMTLKEIAEYMRSLGSWQALNLDGGGSTTMVVDGHVVSRQSEGMQERRVANAVVVVK